MFLVSLLILFIGLITGHKVGDQRGHIVTEAMNSKTSFFNNNLSINNSEQT